LAQQIHRPGAGGRCCVEPSGLNGDPVAAPPVDHVCDTLQMGDEHSAADKQLSGEDVRRRCNPQTILQ
jgi:hypothetical protein